MCVGDILLEDQAQLLKRVPDAQRVQMLKEKLGVRIVSMMEIGLHLSGEGIVHSTFFLRELRIVLPFERKKLCRTVL